MVEFLEVKTGEQTARVASLAETIWRECYDGLLPDGQAEYMQTEFQSARAVRRAIEDEGYLYYITRIDGGEIGYFAVAPQADSLFLSKLYLLRWARGHGCGRECVAFACDKARRLGLKRVWLTVNKQNAAAIAVYEKLGFTQFGEKTTEIGGGYVTDDYLMEKSLEKV